MFKFRCQLLAGLVFALAVGRADADILRVVAFGDSLTDTGNAAALTGGAYPPAGLGYYQGRFSNGPVWIEPFAGSLGVPLVNYAYAGATAAGTVSGLFAPDGTLITPVPALGGQVQSFLTTGGGPQPGDLNVIWAGSNDLFLADPANPVPAVLGAVQGVVQAVANLAAAGATKFLVVNLPPLGSTPYFLGTFPGLPADPATEAGLNYLAGLVNQGLDAALGQLGLAFPGITIDRFDVNGLFLDVRADPAFYGLTDVSDPALFHQPGDGFLFWDTVHPTAQGHQIIADEALQLVTPEPSALAVLLGGLAVAMAARRARVAW